MIISTQFIKTCKCISSSFLLVLLIHLLPENYFWFLRNVICYNLMNSLLVLKDFWLLLTTPVQTKPTLSRCWPLWDATFNETEKPHSSDQKYSWRSKTTKQQQCRPQSEIQNRESTRRKQHIRYQERLNMHHIRFYHRSILHSEEKCDTPHAVLMFVKIDLVYYWSAECCCN